MSQTLKSRTRELPFPTKSADRFRAVKLADVGDAHAKAILVLLAYITGANRDSWDMARVEFCEMLNMSRSTFYRKLKLLTDANLLSVEDIAGTDRQRWRIIYSNLTPENEPATAADADENGVDRSTNNAAASTPPENSLWPFADVAANMSELGVGCPAAAIDQAQARGVSPAELMGLVVHFSEHAKRNGWGPGALFNRVANHTPGLIAARGWPDEKLVSVKRRSAAADAHIEQEQARRQQQADELSAELAHLETEQGDILNGMTVKERVELLKTLPLRPVERRHAKAAIESGNLGRWRSILLRGLANQQKPARAT